MPNTPSTKIGYASKDAKSKLERMEVEVPALGARDVMMQVRYCGVCHSDIHQARNEWQNTVFPCMPGHEVVGTVTEVGSEVTMHSVGDIVGVGCMIDSCGVCEQCKSGNEQYCEGPKSWTATYNGPMKPDGTNTFGGYSTTLVVREDFALKIPAELDPAHAASLLCAGVTTYSPMKHWGVGEGTRMGVVGFGGLGHVALKIATAMGATVTVLSTSPEKEKDARDMGAVDFVLSTDEKAMSKHEMSFDFILSTVPEAYDVNPYTTLLAQDGVITTVGLLGPYAEPLNNMEMAKKRRSAAGSLIGSLAETQEILDFCAAQNITPEIEIIPITEINNAFEKIIKGEVRYRYVIDASTIA